MPARAKPKVTAFTPLLTVVVFLLILGVRLLSADTLGLNDNPYIAVVVIQLITYAVPSLFYYKLRGADFGKSVRLKPFSPGNLLFLLYTAVFLIAGVFLISMTMYSLAPSAFTADSGTDYTAFAMNKRFFDGVYIIIAFAVLPAVTEEFLFRGIIIGEYERFGAPIAVIMSASMFAMSHFSFARFPVYFFSGIVLALSAYTAKSIIAAMVLHALNNAAVLFCERYVLSIVDKHNISLTLLFILLLFVTVLSAMAMCFEAGSLYGDMADRNMPSQYAKHPDRKNNIFMRIAEAFVTPAYLLLVIIFIAAALAEM